MDIILALINVANMFLVVLSFVGWMVLSEMLMLSPRTRKRGFVALNIYALFSSISILALTILRPA